MLTIKEKDMPFIQVRPGLKRKIIHTDTLMTVINDFTDGPWDEPAPPHSHPHEQTGYLAEGEVMFYCEGEPEQHLLKGDMFCVAPNKKHSIKCLTSVVRIVDSFTPIRKEFLSS